MIQFQVRISGKKMEKLKADMDILGREDANSLESQIAVQMEKLADDVSAAKTREEKLVDLRRQLAEQCLGNSTDWEIEQEGPLAVAKHLAGVAKAIGLELPQDWEEKARGFEAAPGKELK